MFDFPATPVDGQTYTTPTGVNYYWDNGDKVWRLAGATMGAGSGLDADTLDGQDGTYYLDLANSTGHISDTQHGQRGGGDLHAFATPTVAGFFMEAPADGLGYSRKNGAWAPSSGGAHTDDNPPPGPLQDGQFWWKSSTGALYLWYDDGNSQQWVQVSASPQMQNLGYVQKTASRFNHFINGSMAVSQELQSFAMVAGSVAYVADMTCAQMSGSPGAGRYTAALVAAPTPFGSANRLRMTVTTAEPTLGSNSYALFNHRIEGQNLIDLLWGTAAGQQVVVRFGVCAPAGTYGISIRNAAASATRTYLATFTVTAAQAMVDTYFTLVIPPELTGSWVKTNALGIDFCWSAACGTTYVGVLGWQNANMLAAPGQSNIFAVNGQTFDLFDIGFYTDPDKTGIAPPFEAEDVGTTTMKCERYWRYWTNFSTYVGYGSVGNGAWVHYPMPAMRAGPSTSFTGISYNSCSTLTASVVSANSIRFNTSITVTGVAYVTFNAILNARM